MVYDLAGGLPQWNGLQTILFGGAAGAFATPEQLDIPLTFEDLRAAGLPLGSGVVMVCDERRDLRDVLSRLGHFFAHESCGKCYPCQLGTRRQDEILRRIAVIKSKWEDRVGAPWPTNVIERPPEVPPEPEKKEPEKPPEKPDVVWEIEGEEAPFQAGGTKEEEPPSEYDQLCATLSGPTQVAKDAIERLSIVTNFDKDIQDRVSGTETNLPLGPKTFLEFLVELSTIVKGKYKNAGDFKVAIVKYEAQDLAWSAYLEWVLKKFSG